MAKHAATLLEEPVTAPIPVGTQSPSSTPFRLEDAQHPAPGTGRSPRIALWACAVAALVAVSGLLGGVTALHLVAPSFVTAPAPAVAAAPITAPAANPHPATAATHDNDTAQPTADRSAARSDSEASSSRSESSSSKRATDTRTGRRTNSSSSPSGDGSTGSTHSAASKSSGSTRSGDGCGPYEHKLSTGWCSPDVGVVDENGNPDPSLAVVPGNLH